MYDHAVKLQLQPRVWQMGRIWTLSVEFSRAPYIQMPTPVGHPTSKCPHQGDILVTVETNCFIVNLGIHYTGFIIFLFVTRIIIENVEVSFKFGC